MKRFKRPAFCEADLKGLHDEAGNRLIFDWWCDDDDRPQYIASLRGKPTSFPSCAPQIIDPAPPLDQPTPQGFRDVFWVSNAAHIRKALTDTDNFSNIPYATLGGASFLLAMDPGQRYAGVDWHAEQKALVQHALHYETPQLLALAARSVDQAALNSLAASEFDLALFAEQAALRYTGQLFGYGFQDHGLLEDASRATYRALQYLAIGQHFVSEPATLPAAQQALGRLAGRTSQLMEDYTRLQRSPRRYGFEPTQGWPVGVQPWSELDLRELGQPILKVLPTIASKLSSRDRATIAATLLAGTLGNIQSAVCLVTQALLNGPDGELRALRAIDADKPAVFEERLKPYLAKLPPLPVLPRRTREKPVPLGCGQSIPAHTDCLLLLEAHAGCPQPEAHDAWSRIWGGVGGDPVAVHACLGREVAMPLIAALVQRVLKLPGLKAALDPLTGENLKVERLWGFACTRYPLRFERERERVQQNLIVSMRVKSPIAENAPRLRRLIAAGVPRIEHALAGFGHLHFAWFEFNDDDTHLVLRTIYDGQFEAYIKYFALRAGDLFDGLFDFLEDAPQRPIAEHPEEFIETIRRHNRAPLAGYLFSAYPRAEAAQIRSRVRPR